MGRAPCCSKMGLNRGLWTCKEDALLANYIKAHGEGSWRSLPNKAGLLRCGKSCRLRWLNYLRPGIKRGNITPEEDDLIIRLHTLLGNRWSLIAGRLPGRTDNEIKNYWNSHLSKRLPEKQNVLLSSSPSSSQRKKKLNNNNPCSKRRPSYNKQCMKNGSAALEITGPKVYLPKATKVRSSSFLSLTRNEDGLQRNVGSSADASIQPMGVLGSNNEEVLPIPSWELSSDFEQQENPGEVEIDRRFGYDEAQDGLLNDANCSLPFSLSELEIPTTATIEAINNNNITLDQLYDDYLQLLGATDHHHQTEPEDPPLYSLDLFAKSSSFLA